MPLLKKIRSVAFIIIVFISLLATLFFAVSKTFGMPSPSWLDLQKTKSELEGRRYTAFPEITSENILSNSFQIKIESFLSDSIPRRDDVVYSFAQIQRDLIALAAFFRNYNDVVPTYYGSGYYYSKSHDSIVPKMGSLTSSFIEKTNNTTSVFTSFIENNPEYSYYLYMPDKASISSSNPLKKYIDNPIDWDVYSDNILKPLSSLPIIVGSEPYIDTNAYYDDYFRTDHHWNINGAYTGYSNIMDMMGISDKVSYSESFDFDVEMYGSFTRRGLCDTKSSDKIADFAFDLPAYEISFPSEKTGTINLIARSSFLEKGKESFSKAKYQDRYAECWPGREWLTTIHNTQTKETRNLVIVGDSFSRPVDRLLAAHFSTTWVIDPRQTDIKLSSFLEQHNADVVLFLVTPEALTMNSYLEALSA